MQKVFYRKKFTSIWQEALLLDDEKPQHHTVGMAKIKLPDCEAFWISKHYLRFAK